MYKIEDVEFVFVVYGIILRVVKSVIDILREEGIKVGFIRFKVLWLFLFEVFN